MTKMNLLLLFIFTFSCLNCFEITISTTGRFCCNVGGTNAQYCANDTLSPSLPSCQSIGLPSWPPAQAKWGQSLIGVRPSGVGFAGVSSTRTVYNSSFFLGTLYHENWPVINYANSTTLDIWFNISIDGVWVKQLILNWTIVIDETPDVPPCKYPSPANNPCADAITAVPGNWTTSQTFVYNNVRYIITLQGFRETNTSDSPLTQFISQENNTNQGYLFALVTSFNNSCQEPSPCYPCFLCSDNGTCTDPDPNQCGCGVRDIKNCSRCNCTSCPVCAAPRTVGDDCGCSSCPADLNCGLGYVDNSATSCCNCRNVTCPSPQQLVTYPNGSCSCQCNSSSTHCGTNMAYDSSSATCCRCSLNSGNCSALGPGYAFNATTCACDCTLSSCSSSNFYISNCACTCNTTALNASCPVCPNGPSFDPVGCICVPCCGNGVVEAGEQCDSNSPCCKNCKFTNNTCNDTNLCNTNGHCDPTNGNCVGTFKCPPIECQSVDCNPTNGTCVYTNLVDGTSCGTGDRCQSTCQQGRCTHLPVLCPNQTTCSNWTCNSDTGNCDRFDFDGNLCDDENPCTHDDVCTGGICAGENITCIGYSICETPICNATHPPISNISENYTATCFTVFKDPGTDCSNPMDNCTILQCSINGTCDETWRNNCSSLNATFCETPVCVNSTCMINYSLKNGTGCDDANLCTINDTCTINGTCSGVQDPDVEAKNITACLKPVVITPSTSYVIVPTIVASAILALLAGGFFLIRRPVGNAPAQTDPMNNGGINSVANNPTYEGANKSKNNPLFEAKQ